MTAKFLKISSLLIIFLLVVSQVFSQNVNLPHDHWGYDFLKRMQAKGLVNSYELRTAPLPRSVIANMLKEIVRRAEQNPDLLSGTDRRCLHLFQSDFSDELSDPDIPPEPHFYSIDEKTGKIHLDLVGRQSVIANRGQRFQPDELKSETMLGGIFRGHLGNTLGFYTEARNALTRGEQVEDEVFEAAEGTPIVTSGANVFRDQAIAYVVLEWNWLRIQAGRDDISWGPAFHGSTALSRNMPPADMIKLSSRFNRFKFTSSHAWLRSDVGRKYLAAHRLDVKLHQNLFVSAGETVVYGNRPVEPAYLNPLMLYHVAEHHLGDKDNNALFVDATFTGLQNVTLYGEWFIDDMTSLKSWTNYFGNKFAFTVGGLWADAFWRPNLDLRFEYTRIDPYVYTHWDSVNIYTHYDKILGHWLGPNGDTAFLELGWQLNRDFRIEASYEHIRKGKGEANTVTRPAKGTEKVFLGDIYEIRQRCGFRMIDQLRRDIFVALSYTYSHTKDWQLKPGNRSTDHLARFELYFNY